MGPHPPSIDALAASLDDGTLPRALLIEVARASVAAWRETGAGDPEEGARDAVARLARMKPERVLNATGVLLHTNLGRAPIHADAAAAISRASTGSTPLEFDLETGTRGGRGAYARRLAAAVTGAEDALIVNNNAGALFLAVAALAGGREIIVSRGEQIEIGGSFRLPELIAATGARAVEVGTTNRTRVRDYAKAIGPETAAILKVHPSNYRVEGFAEEAAYRDLAGVAAQHGIPFVADIGSGLIDERVPWLPGSPPDWLAGEPGARQTIEAGADLVLFSGDKLLGGPQAGIVVGSTPVIGRLAAHPVARAVRIGGGVLAGVTATLEHYAAGTADRLPFWRMAAMSEETLTSRCEELLARSGVAGEVIPDHSVPGAGSVPGKGIPGPVVAVEAGESTWRRLLDGDPPIVARRDEGRVIVDLRSIDPEDDGTVAEGIAYACR